MFNALHATALREVIAFLHANPTATALPPDLDKRFERALIEPVRAWVSGGPAPDPQHKALVREAGELARKRRLPGFTLEVTYGRPRRTRRS